MTRSSRHKSHRQSKHSSKDYSDSEEDVKLKEKSSKDDNLVGDYRGSTAGEKRKSSSQVRDGKEGKDPRNGEASEEYVMSKRRKEKAIVNKERADVNVDVGVDGWSAHAEEKSDTNRNIKREMSRAESSKIDSKLKEGYSKEESLRLESKAKSKKYDNGNGGEIRDDNIAFLAAEKEESECKRELKRKSERDSSGRKEGKDFKDNGPVLEKGKRIGDDLKRGDAEVKSRDVNFGQKQANLGDFCKETKAKHGRETTERPVQDELQNPDLEREPEKRLRRRKEGSVVKDKHFDDFKENDERERSSRGDTKDVKYREDRQKDGDKEVKYHKDGQKNSRHRDNKYREDVDKYSKSRDAKYREDGDRDARYRNETRREDGDRDSRRGDEVFRDDAKQESTHKDEKYLDSTGRDSQNKGDKYTENKGDKYTENKGDKYTEDAEKSTRRRDDRYRGDIDKYGRRNDERYQRDGDKDKRHSDDYKDDGDRDGRYKEDKRREDTECDSWRKDSKRGDSYASEERRRESKSRDQRGSRDLSGEKSDPKHCRDDAYADDRLSRKLITYDDCPKVGDRSTKYKDDLGRRKTTGKGEYEEARSWSTKDQGLESDKKSVSTARIDLATDRGRSISRNTDMELTSHHSRRHSSPSAGSHGTRDPYRLPKQEDSKYYAYEERDRHTVTPSRNYSGAEGGSVRETSSRSQEKFGLKEDGPIGELSAEKHMRLEVRSSPLHLAEKSPASSTDRRYFTRSDGRKSFDVEDSAQRSGALRDLKGYSGKEGRGSRGLVSDIHPGDELALADVDNSSVSSPFTRNDHLSNIFKSIPVLPSPLPRTGLENPLKLGSAKEDGRSKSNSHNRRISNPNLGGLQGNTFRGVPNWPSPMVNGFMPFPQGPPFHSVMQQFPGPPMFGVRSPIELSHPSPYHIPDGDRFSGPGRPMGWRNPVDDSRPPPMYGWDSSAPVFSDESQIYGRPDWDHSRSLPGNLGWDTRGDLWKGSYKISTMHMPSSDKENDLSQIADEALVGQLTQQAQSELSPHDKHVENTDISESRDGLGKNVSEVVCSNLEETREIATISRKDDARLCHFYFSKLDISADLTEPELFNKCTDFLDIDQKISSQVQDSELFYAEEHVEATASSPYKVNNSPLFSAASDSVFQKAMSLYRRLKEEVGAINGELSSKTELILKSNEKLNAEDNNHKSLAGCMGDVGHTVENPSSVEGSEAAALSTGVEEVQMEFSSNNKETKVLDAKFESIESAAVNLSRIHHSPESTH